MALFPKGSVPEQVEKENGGVTGKPRCMWNMAFKLAVWGYVMYWFAGVIEDEKSKTRWSNIHTIVEAKCALKFLLSQVSLKLVSQVNGVSSWMPTPIVIVVDSDDDDGGNFQQQMEIFYW